MVEEKVFPGAFVFMGRITGMFHSHFIRAQFSAARAGIRWAIPVVAPVSAGLGNPVA